MTNMKNKFRYAGSHVVHEDFGDEEVIINLKSGVYYSLSDVGRFLWKEISKEPTFEDLFACTLVSYDGNGSDIKNAVLRFFNELKNEELIAEFADEHSTGKSVPGCREEGRPENDKKPFEAPSLMKYTDQQEMLLLDPIHEVDDLGWPQKKEDSSEQSSRE